LPEGKEGYEGAMSNPAIHPQPNGDVDISVPDEQAEALIRGEEKSSPEPTVDPENLDHPEEVLGE
jgi:hypothetical protein